MKPSPIVVPLLCIIVVAARTAFAAQVAPAPAPLATSTVPGLAQFGTVPGTAADGGALSSEAATARANEASAQATANAALPAATAASTYAPLTSPSLNGLASVNGPAGTPRGLVWGANGVGTRWSLQTDASDNLCLYAFADTAAYLDAPVCFMRNAQELQIYGQVVATVFGSGPDSNGLGPIFSTVNNGPATGAIGFTNQYTSHADAPNFDVGEESISVFDVTAWNANQLSAGANASGPAQYEGFRVASSPNDQTHNFGTAVEEWNIVNRGRDVGFKRDRSLQPVTGGLLMVSEAAAYDAATGGQGLNANYAFSLSHSGGLNSTGFQTKFYDGYQCEPNAVAGLTGRCAYFTGDITGVASQIPYGPMQFDGAWLHGLDTTLATFGDGLAVHLAAGQKVGIGSATIGAGSGANGNLVLSAAGTGTVQSTSPLAAPSFTGNLTGNVTGTASGNDALGLSAAETARATAAEGTLTTNVGSNTAAIALKAPIASPTFTGTVTAPVHSAPAGTATVLATVQPTVASTGYGSSYFIPLASTAGLTTGMGVTGTGIPANAQAMYVSGGTASVTQAAAAAVALGASNVPVSNSTGIYQGMAAFDTTTSTRLNSTALVSGVLGGASAPANLTGLIASPLASGGNTLALTSGGAACLPGMTLVDQTTPTVGLQQVQSSTATSVKLSGTTSAAIATTDTVQCYPTVLLSVQSVETTGGIPSGDSLLFTPAVTITQPMASGLASGTSVTFTPTSASLAASGLTTNGALNLGEGALTVGLGSIRFTGGTAYNTVGTQSQTLIGNGAGANMPPNEALLTAVGFQAGGQLISQNSESTLYGFGAARLLVSGNYVNAFGINSLGSCVYGCTHDIAFGTDAMRNTLSAFSDVAIGDQVMITYTGADSVVIGEGNALGNTSASPSGSFLTGVGYGVFGSASITTAQKDSAFGAIALASLTTGYQDTAVGFQAGNALTTDFADALLGDSAGLGINGGWQNTIVGSGAGLQTSGAPKAMTIVGQAAGTKATGQNNTIVGAQVAQTTLASGSDDILIGVNNSCDTPLSTTSNYFAMCGASATPFISTTSTNSNPVTTIQGTTQTPAVISTGTTFTASGCSASGLVGGAAAGGLNAGVSGACTIVLTMGAGVAAAPHGWHCDVKDETTPVNFTQTAHSTTGCTVTATTTSGDYLSFAAVGY